jgi:glycosyltransferase involved in cell wall biosynthesis
VRPRIAIDFSSFDWLTPGFGLYRYPVDLVAGLAAVRPPADFVLIGSRPEPVPELARVFAEPGSQWTYFQFPRRRGQGAYFQDQWPFARAVRRLRADLVHGLDFFLPFAARCPLVATVYDLLFELFPRGPYRRSFYLECFRRLTRLRVDQVIAISRTTARDLQVRWSVPPSRVTCVYLGTRLPTRPAAAPPPDPAGDGPRLLARYCLLGYKNLPALVLAVAALRGEFPGVRLTLFGRAEVGEREEAEFDRLIHRLGLGSTVHRTGLVSDQELDRLYRSAAVYVLPSLYEGFGLPLLEAMARGVCVIAHTNGATAEVVGPAGILVDARSPDALAAGIAAVLRDPGLRCRLATAGPARAAEFTVERMAEQTFRVYDQCLRRWRW